MLTWSYILGDFSTSFLCFAVLLIVTRGGLVFFFFSTSVISLIFLPCPYFFGFLTGGEQLSHIAIGMFEP